MLCFALLAHADENALYKQIRNIRRYNPNNVLIVLYNGGQDANFGKALCKKMKVMYCPYSRPLQKGKTGRFYYDVMRWLEEKNVNYDFLVYTEYDVMFVNHGFERMVENELRDHDCLVKLIRHEKDRKRNWWIPGKTMWKEWHRWKPFFQTDDFYGTFNPMQVYRRSILKRMLAIIDTPMLEQLLSATNVYALGEMLYITLAKKCGGRLKAYPKPSVEYLRVYHRIRLDDAKEASQKSEVMFVHPVKDADVRDWIFNLKK